MDAKPRLVLRTQAGIWTDIGWWETLWDEDKRVYLTRGDEELELAVFCSDEAAERLREDLTERFQNGTSRFDVAAWARERGFVMGEPTAPAPVSGSSASAEVS